VYQCDKYGFTKDIILPIKKKQPMQDIAIIVTLDLENAELMTIKIRN